MAAEVAQFDGSFRFDKSCFSQMRVIGQFNLGFIIAALQVGSSPDLQLFIVDQHASDEKFRFEALNRESRIERQPLVNPHPLQLAPAQEQLAEAHLEVFRRNGFELLKDEAKPPGRRLRVAALPSCQGMVFNEKDIHDLLYKLEEAEQAENVTGSPHKGGLLDLDAHRGSWSSALVRWFYPKKGWVMGLRREMDFQWRRAAPKKYKVVVLGDEAAGKTSLVRRYMYDTFEEGTAPTVGMDFQSKTAYLEDGRSFRLQLWDTAGQERFRSLIPSYIRDAAAAVIVYDVTRQSSFQGTRSWISDVRAERGDEAVLAVVGNKMDLASERQVSEEEGRELAKELGVMFMETSAKRGDNVTSLFQQLAAVLPGEKTTVGAPSGGGTSPYLKI
ncbi:unnamed protein product [Effrenium voratum]|nr:unnamed protein product [Effrenium voratum]